jgi:hypothetical protein
VLALSRHSARRAMPATISGASGATCGNSKQPQAASAAGQVSVLLLCITNTDVHSGQNTSNVDRPSQKETCWCAPQAPQA